MRSSNFRLLVTSNFISLAGSAVSFVAIPFAVLRIGGTASDVGYVATAGLIPLIAFLLLGGVVADRLPRHRYPAEQGLLPQTVPADQRAQANAFERTSRNAAGIGGAALGGLLVGLAGPGWGLAIDAASFASAALLRLGMRFPSLPPVAAPSVLHDLREGWHEFASRRWLWVIVVQFAVLIAVSSVVINVLGPLVAHSRLDGARSWGFIVAASMAGAVAGSLVMIKFRPRRILVAAMASVPAFSLLLFALAIPLAVPFDVTAAVLGGAGVEVFTVSWAQRCSRRYRQKSFPGCRLTTPWEVLRWRRSVLRSRARLQAHSALKACWPRAARL